MTTTTHFAPTLFSGLFAVAASALFLGFAAAPAEAATVKLTVSAADLATPQGRALVDARIKGAAKQVCNMDNSVRDLRAQRFAKLCTAETIEATRAKVAAIKAASQMAAR